MAGLILGAVFLCAPVHAQEEEDLEDEFTLLEEEMSADEVKSASKHRQSIFWSPSAITVLTREDIRSSGATTLADLLRRVPGFDVYEMKPSFPLVGARALTTDSNNLVLLLVDGREALVELSGWPIWAALSVNLEEMERVEVIRGPGSTLYGANAFAGVVSITTRTERPQDLADVLLSGGEQGHLRLFGRAHRDWKLGDGTLSFGAGIGTEERRSVSDPGDTILKADLNTRGYLRYRLGRDLDLSLHAGGVLGAGPIYMLIGDFSTSGVFNHHVTGQAEIGLSDKARLKAQIYHTRFGGDFHFRSRVASRGLWLADIPDFSMDTNTVDGQLQIDLRLTDRLLLIAGGNLRYTTLESDRIVPSELTEFRGAVFAHAQCLLWDVLQLTGGLRLDTNSQTEGVLGAAGDLSPRAVVVYRPWPDQAFRLGYALAFRKPSFVENQMHIHVDQALVPEVIEKLETSMGNPDLRNEKVHSLELGWRARFAGETLRTSVDLFYNIYQDVVFFEKEMRWDELDRPNIPDSVFQFQNEGDDIQAVGGELEVVWNPDDPWSFWTNLGLRWVLDGDGSRMTSEPILRINAGLRLAQPEGPVLDLALHYVSSYEMPLSLPDGTFDEPERVALGEALLLIGRVGYRAGVGDALRIETGVTLRAPLGAPFREYPGESILRTSQSLSAADYSGERIVRLASFYLRGSF